VAVMFKKITGKTRLMNPLKGYALDEIPFEIRFDPLTGQTGRVFDLPYHPEPPDLSQVVQQSKEIFCPFCPEVLEKSTPLFPKELVQEGRIKVGKAVLIPNLIPFDKYAGISVLSPQHYIAMEDLTPKEISDAFSATLLFVKRVAEVDPAVNFFTINSNYMPPAGSSLVHPHLQVSCGEVPTNQLRVQIEASRRYCEENGTNFWQDFMEAEKQGEKRYIGEINSTFWVMSYVPISYLPDISCIFSAHYSLAQLEEGELLSFVDGLSRILRYFSLENISSFNMSLFAIREGEHFRINARICPRLLTRAIGNSDQTYFQVIHREPYTLRPPESECQKVREIFQES
jgi:UDPglucose--hexose-1-phosphate uridylyltransferase